MDMGVIKPFEVTRPANSAAAVEAGAGASQVKQMDAAQNRSSSSEPVATQTRSAVGQSPEAVRRDINFNLDEDSGRVVINVTEATSGDVIRQIPSEEALRLAENLSEIRSVLFEAEA